MVSIPVLVKFALDREDLPVSRKSCTIHSPVLADGLKKYNKFEVEPKQMKKHLHMLHQILLGKKTSYFLTTAKRLYTHHRKRSWLETIKAIETAKDNESRTFIRRVRLNGYFGKRGAEMMFCYLSRRIHECDWEDVKHLYPEESVFFDNTPHLPLTKVELMTDVLVPELQRWLVSEDFEVEEDEAESILEDSASFGSLLRTESEEEDNSSMSSEADCDDDDSGDDSDIDNDSPPSYNCPSTLKASVQRPSWMSRLIRNPPTSTTPHQPSNNLTLLPQAKTAVFENEGTENSSSSTNNIAPSENSIMEISFENKYFNDSDQLLKYAQDCAEQQGYVLSIQRSNTRQIYIGCDMGGKAKKVKANKKRNSSSKRCGCLFEIYGHLSKKRGEWSAKVKNAQHNHQPAADLSGHSLYRQANTPIRQRIVSMRDAGIRPTEILTSLKQEDDNVRLIRKDIHNIISKEEKKRTSRKTFMQHFFEHLEIQKFDSNLEVNADGNVTHLFATHPKSLHLLKDYNKTFVLDCTYKTNRYQLPLLMIVGMTATNSTFVAAFALLDEEKEANYMWALNQLKRVLVEKEPAVIATDREIALMNGIAQVFPRSKNVLCLWHINQAILAKCRTKFDGDDEWQKFRKQWTRVCEATTITNYDEELIKLRTDYDQFKIVLDYIDSTWLSHKEKFVAAWVQPFLHLGSRNTSRVEGSHAALKKYLRVSTGNLKTLVDGITRMIDRQFDEYRATLNAEKIKVLRDTNLDYFQGVNKKVSHFALKRTHDTYKKLLRSEGSQLNTTCCCSLRTAMGLPCEHVLSMRMLNGQSLRLSDFDEHWHIQKKHCFWHPASEENNSVRGSGRQGGNNEHDENESTVEDTLKVLAGQFVELPPEKKAEIRTKLTQTICTLPKTKLNSRGRPPGSLNKAASTHSTKRNPSNFELAAPEHTKRRRCGLCNQQGHYRSTCPNHHSVNSSNPRD